MKTKRGFTLVELMLYMGLMASVFVVLSEIFVAVLASQAESTQSSSVGGDGRFVIARLFYDINRADDIINPASLGVATTSAVLDFGGINYAYGLDANDKFVMMGNGETNSLTGFGTRVSNVSFTRLGNVGGKNSLQVTFTLTAGGQSKDYQTTVAIR